MWIVFFILISTLTIVKLSLTPNNRTCRDEIYMRIKYSEKLLDDYITSAVVGTAHECAELCRNSTQCKSFGVENGPMMCYVYKDRVYAGLPGSNVSDIIYYWLLEDTCPTDAGYDIDPASNLCTKLNTTDNLVWGEAQKQCEADNGYLFMIDTEVKRTIFDSYLALLTDVPKISIGATDFGDEGIWNWFNGVSINRSYFQDTKPNNFNGSQNCLIYDETGFNDRRCYQRMFNFICEVPTIAAYNVGLPTP